MLLTVAALALAIGPQAAEQPKGLAFLIGTWNVVSVDPGGGEDLHVCYVVQPFVGDKWLSGSATSATPGIASKDVWGYDSASGELFRTIFDMSGTYAVVRSPGWRGDTLVLEGDARSTHGSLRVRESIQRLSADRFKATWQALRAGKWSTYAIETATRARDGECSAS
jgi:hypothetical protein